MTKTKTKPKTCASCAAFTFHRQDRQDNLHYKCHLANRPCKSTQHACSLWSERR